MEFNFSFYQWLAIGFVIIVTLIKALGKILVTYYQSKGNIERLEKHIKELDEMDGNFDKMSEQSKGSMRALREASHRSAMADEEKYQSS